MTINKTTNSKGVTTTATENGTVIMMSANVDFDETTCENCYAPYEYSEGVSAYENGPVFCDKDCAIEALDYAAQDAYEIAYETEGAYCLPWFESLETDVLVVLLDLIREDPGGRCYDDEVFIALNDRDFDFEVIR